jgi:O-antigen ligase
MIKSQFETTMARLLFLGVPATSLLLIVGSVTDPVNVTKFLILGAVGTAAFFLILTRGIQQVLATSKMVVICVIFFILAAISAVAFSNSPLVQNVYGVYGRNTGLLTYIFLSGVLLGALVLQKSESFDRLFLGLFVTGVLNVLYCGWVVFFGDFIGWNNPYGNILGFFGNPNFVGAFLGIWISSTIGYFLSSKIAIWQRALLLVLILLAMFEVYKSHAVQGIAVTAAGLAAVVFFFIRSRTKTFLPVTLYSSGVAVFGLLAVSGALQKGPLAHIIYKTSVSLRGSYWHAGLQSALAHPFTGVGMDGYGDWYRRSRSLHAATVMPGPSTVSNSAHNVIIDIFSYGGFPLLLSYLGLLVLGATSIARGIRRTRSYDPIFVALSVSWIGYQLQSIISINQIGLAVWGWVLTGALVAYEVAQKRALSAQNDQQEKSKARVRGREKSDVISNPLIAGLGLVVGLILACPPISADMAWAKASASGNFIEVQKALTPSYLHPTSSERLVNVVSILENSKLFEQAHEYAVKGTKYNPDNFDAWYALYAVQSSTKEEKSNALENMKRLDPNNPDVTKR